MCGYDVMAEIIVSSWYVLLTGGNTGADRESPSSLPESQDINQDTAACDR